MRQIALHASDVGVALCLALNARDRTTDDLGYRDIGERARISHGEAHNAIKRLRVARLVGAHSHVVAASSLLEFLVYGVRYAFPPMIGAPTRGVPTGPAAPPMQAAFTSDAEPIVWPSGDGRIRGASLVPLIPSAPELSVHNLPLYESLVVVDTIRVGRARERRFAEAWLREHLRPSADGS